MFGCPVPECDYTADNVDDLAGHIGGKQPYCDEHADYGNVRRFELLDCEL